MRVADQPRLLIATADDQVSKSISDILNAWNYPYQIVQDAPEALRLLTMPKPQEIAIIDNSLAGAAGVKLIQAVRSCSEPNRTWMILLDEPSGLQSLRMANDTGADDFLPKPIDPLDLQVRLRVAERLRDLIGKLRKESSAARFHANHDSLTGLLKRESLLKTIFEQAERPSRPKPMGYILFDLDLFSNLNLTYSYQIGDRVLEDLGSRLIQHLRNEDMACRYGEDEFLVITYGCTQQQLMATVDRLRKSLFGEPITINRTSISITASFGTSYNMGRTPLVALRGAERALAQAKLEGRNCIREATRVTASTLPTTNPTPVEPKSGLASFLLRKMN